MARYIRESKDKPRKRVFSTQPPGAAQTGSQAPATTTGPAASTQPKPDKEGG